MNESTRFSEFAERWRAAGERDLADALADLARYINQLETHLSQCNDLPPEAADISAQTQSDAAPALDYLMRFGNKVEMLLANPKAATNPDPVQKLLSETRSLRLVVLDFLIPIFERDAEKLQKRAGNL
jgi:hypothetical protein